MLAIRMQRLGRKGLPVYRLAVQEAHRHPSSGRVVAYVGSFDPHSKTLSVDEEKTLFYLNNGARPSSRVIRLLKEKNIALPSWVQILPPKKQTAKHPEKLRKNQPKAEPPAEERPAEETAS